MNTSCNKTHNNVKTRIKTNNLNNPPYTKNTLDIYRASFSETWDSRLYWNRDKTIDKANLYKLWAIIKWSNVF